MHPEEEVSPSLYTDVEAKERLATLSTSSNPNRASADFDTTSYTFADFFSKEFTTPAYIVDRLVVVGGVNVIVGPSYVGKTFITLEFLIKVALGEKVFGEFATMPGTCLLVNEEDTERTLHKRAHSMTTRSDLPIHLLLQKGFKINNKDTFPLLLAKVKELGCTLVVLDNLSRLFVGDENSSAIAGEVRDGLSLLTQAGATVVLVHHQRKDGKEGSTNRGIDMMRGSSAIGAGVDTILAVRHFEDAQGHFLEFSQDKNKHDEPLKPFRVNMMRGDDESLRFVYAGELDENATKIITAQDTVFNFLSANRGMKYIKKDLYNLLSQIGQHTIEKALSTLSKRTLIRACTRSKLGLSGTPNELMYWVSSEEEVEENPLFN